MPDMNLEPDEDRDMRDRAAAIAASSVDAALSAGLMDPVIELTLSEALVIGLLKQGVRRYFVIFGHGSTDFGEVLRVYAREGAVDVLNCRNEVAMAHAATAHAWVYGETPAVVTSIGPGALQAMAGSLAAASNGIGVYHLYGDETTRGEGFNMQQVPKREQGVFGKLTALMGQSYTLHTPGSLRECLRRGTNCVHHPYKPGPSPRHQLRAPPLQARTILRDAAHQHATPAHETRHRRLARPHRHAGGRARRPGRNG